MKTDLRRWIDVRQPYEFAEAHIEGSELVPLGALAKECASWDRRQPITLVCRSGQRAERARATLAGMKFEDLNVLPGGVSRWRSEGHPLRSSDGVETRGAGSAWLAEGALILTSFALAWRFSPWFLLVAAVVAVKLVRGR